MKKQTTFRIHDKANVRVSVILDRKGKHVATVQWLYPRDGASTVHCQVFAPSEGLIWHGKAGGYGYDKSAAALSGAVIDGIKLANHCGSAEDSHEKAKARLMRRYVNAAVRGITHDETNAFAAKARKMGCHFANYCRSSDMPSEPGSRPGEVLHGYRYTSLHTMPGLDRLSAMDYRVINAI